MKKFEFLRSCFRCLFMTFGLAPRQMSLYTSVNIFHSMLGIVMTLVLQSFFDAAAEYALHKLTLLDILSIVLLIGIVYLIYHILDGLVDCFAELTVIKMEKNLQIKVIKKNK